MRNIFLAGVAMLGFVGAAYAGEGNGEPFPGPSAEVTTVTGQVKYGMNSQDPYQYRVAGAPTTVTNFKAVATKDTDPYQYRVAGQTIKLNAPVTGPQTGTATASTTHGITNPPSGSHG